MKNTPNYLAILTFYVIAITLRYLTNKTDLLSAVPNAFLKAVLTGIGPTVGAIVAFALFKIKPVMSRSNKQKITRKNQDESVSSVQSDSNPCSLSTKSKKSNNPNPRS